MLVSDDAVMEKPSLTHTQSVLTISPEQFEKLYLTPKTNVPGDFRKRFANPSPLGLLGFVIAAATFAMILMGWGGADGSYGVVGMFLFTGPVLLLLSTVFEWIMGNFFSMMVHGMFAVFWLSLGVLQLPTWGLAAAYSKSGSAAEGAASVEFNAAIALYLTVWGFALFTFFIFTLRLNIVFCLIFGIGSTAIWTYSAAFWRVAAHNYDAALKLQKTAGAQLFVVAFLGWYLILAQMAAEMQFTMNIPVGDLSHYWAKLPTPRDIEMDERNTE